MSGLRTALRYTVEPVLFFTFLTMSLEISLVQQLIKRKVCEQQFADVLDCANITRNATSKDVVNVSSRYISKYDALLSLLTLIVGLWFGSWADRFGRKRLMIVPAVGSILSTLNFIVVSYFLTQTSPWLVLLSAVIVGFSTGTLGTCATCFGLISGTTSTQWRSTRIAFLEAAMFLGGSAGFYLVGFMKPRTSFVAVFSLELAIHLLNLLYIIFVVREPERLRQADTDSATFESIFSFNHVRSMVRTVIRSRENNYRSVIILLLCSSLMLSYGLAATSYLTFIFLHTAPLHFTDSEYSYYHGGLVAVQGISIVVIMPLCLTFLQMKDATAGFLGALSRCLGLFWMSFATSSKSVYITLAMLSLSEFAVPSIRSLVSKIVGSNEKAQVFAFMSVLQSFAFFTGSLIFVGLFETTSARFYPGFGFTLAGCLQLIPVAILAYLYFALDMDTLRDRPFQSEQEYSRYQSTDDTPPESQD